MAWTPGDIVSDLVRNVLSPPPRATLSLDRPINRLRRPAAASHAHWRALPGFVLAPLFRHLPVPDLVRLGYLFTPLWRDVWRFDPLCLHDKQFASLPIPRSEVANAIANVLEEYLDGEGAGEVHRLVHSFRVETTEWGPDHAARWCAALRRGKVVEVVLCNRGSSGDQPPMLVRVPPRLLGCTTLRVLDLAFFTVEAGELDALTRTTALGLHGCACRTGVVEGVVAACGDLQELSVHDGAMDSVVVRSAPNLSRLSMLRTVSHSLTVDDAPLLHELIPGSAAALSIKGAPCLTCLVGLNLPDTTLEIDGAEITVGRQAPEPQMPSVRRLWLALNYTALRGMEEHMVPRMVQQMLMRFPSVDHLTIERKDDVPQEEGMASRDDAHTHGHLNLYGGLEGVAHRLHTLTLFDFRAGKAELELVKALMDTTQVLATVELAYSARRHGIAHATTEAHAALHKFTLLSINQSLRKFVHLSTEIE